MSSQPPPSTTDFELLLASADLPPAGPAYYEARRQLWLTPRPITMTLAPERHLESRLALPESYSTSRSIQDLWKGICSGRKLRNRVPLRLMITIVHTAWIQEETWPKGVVVPSSDEPPPE
ncbi:hypothetical protein APHAL10511_001753 [Amanita phalloides]|nr:hypothetical protein APHAL10511_001753 [Amanita phalloides]